MNQCKVCSKEVSAEYLSDHKYATGEFCSTTCASKFASHNKQRKNDNKTRSKEEVKTIREMLNQKKLKSGCSKCKYNESSLSLEFYLSEADISLSKMILYTKYSLEEIKEYVLKADIFCLNCSRTYRVKKKRKSRKVEKIVDENEKILKQIKDLIKSKNL